jgi:hypothetical protein
VRHLRSILYTLVLAPAVWILCGVGFDHELTGRARDNGGLESLSGVLLLLLAGAAYAILLFAPISPLGPSLAGLALLAVGAWARLAPESYADVWPAKVASDGFDVSTPGYGLAVLLAVPLLGTALSARRWAGYEPPRILFVGTLGRARGAAAVAGTTMASEPTAVIPHQRRSPESTEDDTTRDVPTDETTREVTAFRTDPVADDEVTTLLAAPTTEPDDGAETQLLTLIRADDRPTGAVGPGEQTQVIPGDHTQPLTPPPPGEAATVATPDTGGERTKAMSIVAAERPDPGEDPTTRLTPSTAAPGEATTRSNAVRPATTATNLERPADEAADQTRRL